MLVSHQVLSHGSDVTSHQHNQIPNNGSFPHLPYSLLQMVYLEAGNILPLSSIYPICIHQALCQCQVLIYTIVSLKPATSLYTCIWTKPGAWQSPICTSQFSICFLHSSLLWPEMTFPTSLTPLDFSSLRSEVPTLIQLLLITAAGISLPPVPPEL